MISKYRAIVTSKKDLIIQLPEEAREFISTLSEGAELEVTIDDDEDGQPSELRAALNEILEDARAELASFGVSAVQSDAPPSFEDALLEKYKDQLNA